MLASCSDDQTLFFDRRGKYYYRKKEKRKQKEKEKGVATTLDTRY